jgi:hypothetical protein
VVLLCPVTEETVLRQGILRAIRWQGVLQEQVAVGRMGEEVEGVHSPARKRKSRW